MGATSLHREPGKTTHEFLEELICGHKGGGRFLASGIRNNPGYDLASTLYAAWELGPAHGDDEGKVTALVSDFHYGGSGEWNFTYKAWTESSLPDHEAPARVLALLTPTENENELEWRRRCREYNDARAAKPRVFVGDTVVFAQPIKFTSGDEYATFVKQKGDYFKAVSSRFDGEPFGNYRIRRWRERDFTVRKAA